MSLSLEDDVKKYSFMLTEFMSRDEVLKIEEDGQRMVEAEYAFQKIPISSDTDTWDKQFYQKFRTRMAEYRLERMKEVYRSVLDSTKKSNKSFKPVFYVYKPLTKDQIAEKVKARVNKEGKQ
ncbi:hypothetical protein HZA97_04715 [Candidatus Woesearchaeota archaeon]|nr:hypothetical protein [Candidatus Woesearchaeota archaeon]